MSRVVFDKNAEPDKWFRLESLLQDIAAHRPSDPSIVPDGPAIDQQDSAPDSSGVVALSPQPDIFQSATAATALSQGGGPIAARHEVAFIDPSISDREALLAEMGSEAEAISMVAAVPAPNAERKRANEHHRSSFKRI